LRPDVSQIIDKSEATAILGEPVKDPSPRSGDGADGYYSRCNYYSVHRGKSLIIRLQLPGPNAIGPQKELQLLLVANGGMEKVSGIGDAAQMFTGVATAASLRDSTCFTLPTGMHFSPLALAVLSTMPSPWKRRGPSRKKCSSIFERGERRD
jgi:hypothetical protein